ncbi:MAG: cell division suppressor protein YneA [bacterium]
MYNAVVRNTYKNDKGSNKVGKYIIVMAVIVSLLFLGVTSQGSKPIEYNTITIQQGDTLWSIVKTIQSDEMDPRKMISQIKRINSLEDSILQPGQIIKIPVW